MKSAWRPSHRVLVRLGKPGSLLGVHVMQTDGGAAYSRFAWMQGLEPTVLRNGRGEWVVSNATEVGGDGCAVVVVRVDPLDDLDAPRAA